MKLKNYIATVLMLSITLCTYAQNAQQQKADNLFNNFAFVQATNAYHKLINQGINTNYATRQLADSYSYLRNPDSAVIYYEKVIKQNNVPTAYYYNYSQALRGVEDYKTSRTLMKQFKDAGGDIEEARYLKDSDFLNAIFNAKKHFTLKDVKFNSKYSDFGAYKHGNKIYFTSARDKGDIKKHINAWDEEPFLNIYAINANSNDTLIGNKAKLKGRVNSVYHDGPLTITKDGKTMYFSRTDFIKNVLGRNGNGISNLKIYKATLVNGKWKNIEELPFNSNHFSNGHPALSEDETKLYFASDRSGGHGGSDIYYVDIYNGTFGKPQNLGATVNTSKNEKFPFVNREGALFFSSDGHPGLGLLDIYGTVADENKNIVSVINLGTPVNSSKDDFSFFMNEDGLSGYFASNRKGGAGSDDIYAFERVSTLELEETKNETDLEIAEDNTISTAPSNTLKTESIEDVSFSPIYFNFNSASIRNQDKIALDNLVNTMLDVYPNMSIDIESFSDARGTETYNDMLSQKRATNVYNYLLSKGVLASRITSYMGYGEKNLINDCNSAKKCTEAQHQENRRTEFTVQMN
ncbi:OmpA family protein [Algibacter amylolyticus]|uniref:OmpA family protein n=1 Tax=Algibacter amylolyticus TaxID=1608400 RepID=A0A5M7AYF5_9FLAO|nr:OmpA family protein [Algibacter amylolyticus]KAA5821128.1 OmpA family protein [Algibacter amylolyticus]MBB5269773.1 outer membrane protein OmpA-like peptidoglycan-associated protein [Algibacter amylolyticus]TSJ72074.1 OmpA family protein [Algibacter amylolyticus]